MGGQPPPPPPSCTEQGLYNTAQKPGTPGHTAMGENIKYEDTDFQYYGKKITGMRRLQCDTKCLLSGMFVNKWIKKDLVQEGKWHL